MFVDTHNNGFDIAFCRGGYDNFFSPCFYMGTGLFTVCKETGRLNNIVNTKISPGDICRVTVVEDGDRSAVNNDTLFTC